MPRLSAKDLGVLGRYLYGPRWQSTLARELGVSRQLVVYWAAGKRAVSIPRSQRIAEIARAAHDRRVSRERGAFIAMAEGLSSATARSLLLALIANEVTARLLVIGKLTGEIERGVVRLGNIARHEVLAGSEQGKSHLAAAK
jgi:transcriptional regulator with XRE-family HTH domain